MSLRSEMSLRGPLWLGPVSCFMKGSCRLRRVCKCPLYFTAPRPRGTGLREAGRLSGVRPQALHWFAFPCVATTREKGRCCWCTEEAAGCGGSAGAGLGSRGGLRGRGSRLHVLSTSRRSLRCSCRMSHLECSPAQPSGWDSAFPAAARELELVGDWRSGAGACPSGFLFKSFRRGGQRDVVMAAGLGKARARLGQEDKGNESGPGSA